MSGVFLSLFKTVDLSAHHFRHRRRRPHSCSPQQHGIRSDVWYSSRRKFSPKLIGPAETTEVYSSRRRSRQSSTSRCHHASEGRRVRKADSSGDGEGRFVKHRARSIAAPTFSTSTLTTPDRCMSGRLCDQKTHEYPPHPRKPPAKERENTSRGLRGYTVLILLRSSPPISNNERKCGTLLTAILLIVNHLSLKIKLMLTWFVHGIVSLLMCIKSGVA